MISVSVLVCVKNEEARLDACLRALTAFDDVIVVDSHSTDRTAEIAQAYARRVEPFQWNGRYPKKYQWALDHITMKYDRVLFVDADEILDNALVQEIATLDWPCDGYFIKGRPVWHGTPLRFGLWNNKLALFDRTLFRFPVVHDLDLPGSMEIEGHYQPVARRTVSIGQLRAHMLHDCAHGWDARHDLYAQWEAGMMARNAFPPDPSPRREYMKRVFRIMPLRGWILFAYGYVVRLGFADGRAGFDYAMAKARYYAAISRARKAVATGL